MILWNVSSRGSGQRVRALTGRRVYDWVWIEPSGDGVCDSQPITWTWMRSWVSIFLPCYNLRSQAKRRLLLSRGAHGSFYTLFSTFQHPERCVSCHCRVWLQNQNACASRWGGRSRRRHTRCNHAFSPVGLRRLAARTYILCEPEHRKFSGWYQDAHSGLWVQQ